MSDRNKMLIFLIMLVAIIVTTIVIVVNNNKKEEKDKYVNNKKVNENVEVMQGEFVNINSKLREDKKFENYEVKDILLTKDENGTTLSMTISSKIDLNSSNKRVVFYDDRGTVIDSIVAYMPQIKNGKTVNLKVQTTKDLVNAYDFKIE